MTSTDVSPSPAVAKSHIRILIADDHEVMRMGIRNLLESRPNWKICAEACDGRDAVEKSAQLHPDVIIMDVTMPSMNGLEAARLIHRSLRDIPVILFSLHVSEELVSHFGGGNIRGAVCKSTAGRDLVEAVEKVLAGGCFFPASKSVPSH